MSTTLGYYHSNILPWTFVPDEERRFRRVIQVALVFYFIVVIAASVITVPKPERSAVQPLPPQLAKLILEREKPKPKPPEIKEEKKPEQKKEADKPKPEEKKKPEKKVEEKPEPVKEDVPPPPPKVDLEAARKKAARSGLLALSDDLADLREAPTVNLSKSIGVTKNTVLAKESTSAPQVLTQSRSGSGGVDTRALTSGIASRRIGGGGDLQARATEQVDSPVEAQAKLESKSPSKTANRVLPRSEEEIQLIFQRYKGAITQMYQRARREDPTLKGKVVFEITIEPSGAVSACKVVSSEMDAPDLLAKVVARIKTINFGAKDVPTFTISFPFEFIPTD